MRSLFRPFWPTVRLVVCIAAGGLLLTNCDTFLDLRPPGQPAGRSAALRLVADSLTHPVALTEPADGTGRRFIVDQVGLIHILDGNGTLLKQPFLDLRSRMVGLNTGYDERGLLGLAFHPDYAANGRFFVYYSAPLRATAPENFNHTSHIAEFRASATNPNVADPASERLLLQVDQPQGNHNGGTLAFGPTDGYLYISLGDGGGRNDSGAGHVADWYGANDGGNAQDVSQNLLGSILRIDVDGVSTNQAYAIPADNPFVGMEGILAEQWAYGFRNPYRMAFDPGGQHWLYAGDAGQELYEEVSVVLPGGNYGWNVKEGTHCFDAANPRTPPATCPSQVTSGPMAGQRLIDPVIEFENTKAGGLGLVVIGGHVYRGRLLPQLTGKYLFGVWSKGRGAGGLMPGGLFITQPRGIGTGPWPFDPLRIASHPSGGLTEQLLGFGQDAQGEVYVLTTTSVGPAGHTGKVYQLAPPETAMR